jgi:hypothetical protein
VAGIVVAIFLQLIFISSEKTPLGVKGRDGEILEAIGDSA